MEQFNKELILLFTKNVLNTLDDVDWSDYLSADFYSEVTKQPGSRSIQQYREKYSLAEEQIIFMVSEGSKIAVYSKSKYFSAKLSLYEISYENLDGILKARISTQYF